MKSLDQLKEMGDDYQLKYCWARAVEWEMLPAFVAQPVLPMLFAIYPWKTVLVGLLVVNFVWNLVFCTAVISLPLAAFAMVWTKLKWLPMGGFGTYFVWQHHWLLAAFTLFTPIVCTLLGNITLRRPVGLIQEFFMLHLGHVKTEPSAEVARYLSRLAGS